jgi:hypothetical protein
MHLIFIQTKICPKCNCAMAVEERVDLDGLRIRQHSNGGHWEYRTWACGYAVRFVPNFDREEVNGTCTEDPKYKEREKKRAKAKSAVLDYISELDVDDEFKATLTRWL